jgi:hypothetical protein
MSSGRAVAHEHFRTLIVRDEAVRLGAKIAGVNKIAVKSLQRYCPSLPGDGVHDVGPKL